MPDADVARWKTYLEAFTSPGHRGRVSTGSTTRAGEADRIPMRRKLAHAFAALLEHLDPRKLPDHGGDATVVMVTLTLDQLRTRLATAGIVDCDLDTGANLTVAQARRLACNARIIPVVLGGTGEILDQGRARRLFTPAQRKAIRLRDKGCRGEGCTVPAAWTEIHHVKPWAEGGSTDVADGRCYCNHHHHLAHDPRYRHEDLPNGKTRFHRRT